MNSKNSIFTVGVTADFGFGDSEMFGRYLRQVKPQRLMVSNRGSNHVAAMAASYCRNTGLELVTVADNDTMLAQAHKIVAFWDNQNRWTQYVVNKARRTSKLALVVEIKATPKPAKPVNKVVKAARKANAARQWQKMVTAAEQGAHMEVLAMEVAYSRLADWIYGDPIDLNGVQDAFDKLAQVQKMIGMFTDAPPTELKRKQHDDSASLQAQAAAKQAARTKFGERPESLDGQDYTLVSAYPNEEVKENHADDRRWISEHKSVYKHTTHRIATKIDDNGEPQPINTTTVEVFCSKTGKLLNTFITDHTKDNSGYKPRSKQHIVDAAAVANEEYERQEYMNDGRFIQQDERNSTEHFMLLPTIEEMRLNQALQGGNDFTMAIELSDEGLDADGIMQDLRRLWAQPQQGQATEQPAPTGPTLADYITVEVPNASKDAEATRRWLWKHMQSPAHNVNRWLERAAQHARMSYRYQMAETVTWPFEQGVHAETVKKAIVYLAGK